MLLPTFKFAGVVLYEMAVWIWKLCVYLYVYAMVDAGW